MASTGGNKTLTYFGILGLSVKSFVLQTAIGEMLHLAALRSPRAILKEPGLSYMGPQIMIRTSALMWSRGDQL